MISARTLRQLGQIDWDFPEHLPGTTKNFHWYPGTFPSDLPTTLIQALSKSGDLVVDPYGGVGTTALEALRQGRKAWAIEANPIGGLVAYVAGGIVLLKAISPMLPSMVVDMLRNVVLRCMERRSDLVLLETSSMDAAQVDLILEKLIKPAPNTVTPLYAKAPNLVKLSEWVEGGTLVNIVRLLDAIGSEPIGCFGRLLGFTMVSAILRPASSQTKSWGHIADNVKPKVFEPKDAYRLCLRWLSRVDAIAKRSDVSSLLLENRDAPQYWVSFHNWLQEDLPEIVPDVKGALLVTSPPYAGAIDYTLAQRLSLYAFGFVDEEVSNLCRAEIGARRKRFDSISHQTWASQMAESLCKQLARMDDSSCAVFVLPHKDAGRELGTDALRSYMTMNGWEQVVAIDRSIRQIRARQSWTSIKKETVHVFERQG